MRTAHQQYDLIVPPLRKWLEARGVKVTLNTRVTDLAMRQDDGWTSVDRILYQQHGTRSEITVDSGDVVIVNQGSMSDSSAPGTMDRAPTLHREAEGNPWVLWRKIAVKLPDFGLPAAFADHIGQRRFVSFTVTLQHPIRFDRFRNLTGSAPSKGGLITFLDSAWLASIVIPHQPHSIGPPERVSAFWGYGLAIDQPGDFVKKPMSACSGREIMTELLGHLRLLADASRILDNCSCIPCLTPFVTRQSLPRAPGDLPDFIPEGSRNLAFVGQCAELPEVEYAIRSAQSAVHELLGQRRAIATR